MTLPMLEALRTDPVEVTMSLVRASDEATPIDKKGGRYDSPANEFLLMKTLITNMSRKSTISEPSQVN